MTEGNILKRLTGFALPMFATLFFQQLYSTVDAVIVGRFASAEGLAAIGATMQVIIFTVSIGIGFMMGISTVIGESVGAGDRVRVRCVVVISYAIVLLIYLLKVIVAVFLADDILTLMNTPEAVMKQALGYLRIMFIGGLGTYCYSMVLYILRACGKSVSPLILIIISSIINVILDLVFVTGLGWGVQGAAIATVIAENLAMLMCFVYIRQKAPELWITWGDVKNVKKQLTVYVVKLSVPASLQVSLVTFCSIFVQAVINKYGVDTVAGYTAAQKIEQIVMMFLNAYTGALGVFIAQNRGAGKMERVKKSVMITLTVCSVMMLLCTLLITWKGKLILGIFTDAEAGKAVIEAGWNYMGITSLFYIVLGIWQVISSYLRGMADAVVPLIVGTIQIIANLGGVFILEPAFGIKGIWYAVVLSWICCAAAVTIRSIRRRTTICTSQTCIATQ